MKSKLQDGDVCVTQDGEERTVQGSDLISGAEIFMLEFYNEDLSRFSRQYSALDIVKVIRNSETIWQRTESINKMMTGEVNGENYPLPTHENMKILVDKISELELRIKNLENGKS